ncbi:hypothetical protein GCM10020220_092730 [Nonomuraea rubra]|uniref:glycoside hydrolase family 78 protein n=1 Tax=Nonomuraea rubra TaxID=46180 RepID=UPI0031E8289D
MLNITAPAFEHHSEPLGIGESGPRLSWTVTTDTPGWTQAGYEIELGDGTATGRVESAESVLVPWPGTPLGSRERRGARVRVHGADGSASDWSPWSYVEAGLLEPATGRPRPPRRRRSCWAGPTGPRCCCAATSRSGRPSPAPASTSPRTACTRPS